MYRPPHERNRLVIPKLFQKALALFNIAITQHFGFDCNNSFHLVQLTLKWHIKKETIWHYPWNDQDTLGDDASPLVGSSVLICEVMKYMLKIKHGNVPALFSSTAPMLLIRHLVPHYISLWNSPKESTIEKIVPLLHIRAFREKQGRKKQIVLQQWPF